MSESIGAFCELLSSSGKSNANKAVALLWFFDQQQADIKKTSGQLTRLMDDHHLGTPNQTTLAQAIRKTKLTNETKLGFSLKPGSRKIIKDWFPDLVGYQPLIDQTSGFLSDALWKNTRGYIEDVCREINGCIVHGYYNASAVMLRRLLETLIIESYEFLNRSDEIKAGDGNYLMLSDLADRACGEKTHAGLNLGRDSKKALRDVKNVGNWSAHARRFIAKSNDLTSLQVPLRLLVQELVHIAELQKK